MPDTVTPSVSTTPTNSSNAASGNTSSSQSAPIPTNRLAAVSQAISQAVPPNRQAVQTESQSTRQAQPSTKPDSNSDREISVEDFDAIGEENPFTPKPTNRVKQHEQRGKTDKQSTPDTTEIEATEGESANSQEAENQADSTDDSGDNKLELDINLDENADPSKLATEKQKPTGNRDYSKFKPEHQEILKKIPNHLFAKATQEFEKIYQVEQENNQLKEKIKNSELGKLPDNYYEHPQAFQLSPNYSRLTTELNYDQFEASHWQQQLVNIKKGQPWIELVNYDKNGNPMYERREPLKDSEGNAVLDVESEVRVQQQLAKVQQLTQEHNLALQQLKANYGQEVNRSKEGIVSLKKQFFNAFSDESKLPPVVKADIQMAKDAIAQQIPAFRNNPMSELLVLSYAAIKAQQRNIVKMAQMLNASAEKVETARRAGPGKLDFQGGSASGEKILDAKEFED